MKRLAFLAALCALAAALAPERAPEIEREVQRIAGSRALWPGFEPLAIPLAVYDGQRTWLFRHPAPPEGFAPVPGAHVYPGRHPAVTSNTSEDLGGTVSATLMADRPGAAPAELAAVALHEAFHVFQRRRHPGWQANEGDLLLYPFDNAKLLGRRRLESEALRRALAEPKTAACWARQFLAWRRERFAAIDPAFAAYERGTELNEGLAQYIQLLAAGRTPEIPADEFAAAEVRHRIYTTGPAIAFLLDRLRPGWQASLEADDKKLLEDLLAGAAAEAKREGDDCAFTPAEIERVERVARADTAAIRAGRTARRQAFDARPGWRVVIQAAEGRPLWPQGFDPLNVELVDGGLLHTRFLRLGNDAGKAEAIDGEGTDLEALTEGIGPHPLFNGVRRAAIAGLPKPEIRSEGGTVEIHAPGLSLRFENARVEVRGTEAVVSLQGGGPPTGG